MSVSEENQHTSSPTTKDENNKTYLTQNADGKKKKIDEDELNESDLALLNDFGHDFLKD